MTTTPTPASQQSPARPAGYITHDTFKKLAFAEVGEILPPEAGAEAGKIALYFREQPPPARSDKDAERPAEIALPGGSKLRYEARTTGEPGWLLYDRSGQLLHGLALADVQIVEATIAATRAAKAQESAPSDCGTVCRAAKRDGIACPPDSCDIEDGTREVSAERATAGNAAPENLALVVARLEQIAEVGTEEVRTLAAEAMVCAKSVAGTTAAPTDVCAEMRALCSACGGTGDVHSIDGEWRGACDCEASAWSRASNTATAAPGDLPPLPEPRVRSPGNPMWTLYYLADQMREYGRACIASNAGAAIPEGCALVPVEPTLKMIGRGRAALYDGRTGQEVSEMFVKRCYAHMLAAAPSNSPVGAKEKDNA